MAWKHWLVKEGLAPYVGFIKYMDHEARKMNTMSKSQASRMLLQRRTEYTIFIQELGNPFLEGGGNLMAIHIWDIMDDTVVKTVRNVAKIGEKQSNSFANERLVERSKPVTQPLKKNNLPTFTSTNKKTVSKDKTKVEVLKDDCALFLRLYIACQICDGNAKDFFKYENQLWQPPL